MGDKGRKDKGKQEQQKKAQNFSLTVPSAAIAQLKKFALTKPPETLRNSPQRFKRVLSEGARKRICANSF